MRFSGIPEQGWYSYDDNWKKEMDTMLLQQVLMVEMESGAIAGTRVKSPHALLIVAAEINKKFKKNLTLGDIEDRLEVLHGRLNLYNHVMCMPQTYWDREGNRIVATDDVWARIFAGNVFTHAYYREGEPEYYRMCSAFGLENLKLEPSREIIDVPSDSSTLDLNSLASCEEVTSLILIAPAKLVRKLFHDDASSTEEVQPEKPFSHVYVKWPHISTRPMLPPRNVFHLKPCGSENPCTNVLESSCASSNTCK